MTSALYWKIFLCFWQWYTNYCLYIFNSLICHILEEKWFWFQTKLKCMTNHIMKYVVSLNPVVNSVRRKLFSSNRGPGVLRYYDCISKYAQTLLFVVKPAAILCDVAWSPSKKKVMSKFEIRTLSYVVALFAFMGRTKQKSTWVSVNTKEQFLS